MESNEIWNDWVGTPSRRMTRTRSFMLTRTAGRWNAATTVQLEPSLPWEWMVPANRMTRKRNEREGVTGENLGIDLRSKESEVRKLFYAGGFQRRLISAGLDPEEFLQELFRGILARNIGICPWDARKSTFGHYVHIVIKCVLANYLRKEKRRMSLERVTDDGEVRIGDSVSPGGSLDGTLETTTHALFPQDRNEAVKAREFLTLIACGMNRKDATSQVGRDLQWGDRVLRETREHLT